MVRFQCDGKRKRNENFLVFVNFFRKVFGARYLIGNS